MKNWQEIEISTYEKADGMFSISVFYATYNEDVKNEKGAYTPIFSDCFSKVVDKATAEKLRRVNEKGWC